MSGRDGGPAFPSVLEWRTTIRNDGDLTGCNDNAHDGMTLRDYFAVRAPDAPGWWVNELVKQRWPMNPGQMIWNGPTEQESIAIQAEWAFLWADTMLAQREKASR